MSKGSLKYREQTISDDAVPTPTFIAASHLLNVIPRLYQSHSIDAPLMCQTIPINDVSHIINPVDYSTPAIRPARRTLNRRGSEEPAIPSDTAIIIRIELLIVFVNRREGL